VTVRILETVSRRSALALRAVDASTGRPITEALKATAWPAMAPDARSSAAPATPAGIMGFRSLAGLDGYQDGSIPRGDWFDAPATRFPQPFTVVVADSSGRYLTTVRTIAVPQPGPVEVGLVPAPSTTAAAGFALVVGQLIREVDGRPATWAVVRVAVGSVIAGGVSDARGAFAVHVPLSVAPDTATPGTVGPVWTITITVLYGPDAQLRALGTGTDDPPTVESMLSQPAAEILVAGVSAPSLTRIITRGGPVVVASATNPPPSTLLVRPS
jgi:hypothetical protein